MSRRVEPVAELMGGHTASTAAEFVGLAVDQVMITRPKTMPVDATVGDVQAALTDGHVHMVLLTESGALRGTIIRTDLVSGAAPTDPAFPLSTLCDRTVRPKTSAADIFRLLRFTNQRRLAVVSSDARLLGLVCLKRRLNGFCSDQDVTSRACGPLPLRAAP